MQKWNSLRSQKCEEHILTLNHITLVLDLNLLFDYYTYMFITIYIFLIFND